MRVWSLVVAVVWCCVIARSLEVPAAAATVVGATLQPSVVWVSDGSTASDPESQVRNQNRQFVPGLIVIRAGDSVRFPNDDPFFHSIYSASPNDPFDIGYYGFGPGKLVNFLQPGIVDVHCHIHAKMHGTIVVTDGPNSGGLGTHFALQGVMSGAHRIYFWNERDGLKSSAISVPAGDATEDVGTLR